MINFTGRIKIAVYGSIIFAMYFSALSYLVKTDWGRDDYSYGVLIPFIVAYLIWERRARLTEMISRPSWVGFVFFVPGICLFWIGELGGEFFITYFSLWLTASSLCLIHLGWKKFKILLFPVLFSLSMFPLPAFINNKITISLKIVSSKIGVMMMQVYGMSAFREGNIIDLGFTKLQVVDACSGLRYLFPMIILSILIAYYYRATIWKKTVLVLSSIPLTIFSNSLRIALTGILSEKFGSIAVEGFFHDFEGLLIFMFTLGVLVLEKWVLDKMFPQKKNLVEAEDHVMDNYQLKPESVVPFKIPQFIVSILLLCTTLALSQGIEFREAIPMNKTFDNFPMQIGKWGGTRQTLENKFVEELDFTDYIMADYTEGASKNINFYVAYYASQRKGESIHSPASCLRGGGWNFREAGDSSILLGDNTPIKFNRAIIEKKPFRQISYYWFPSRDRVLTNAYQMKWFNFWDALTRQRTDGALVRVITAVYPDEDIQQAEKRIKEFVKDVYPILSEFLPN